jgi:SAM-dependent methyltransferase
MERTRNYFQTKDSSEHRHGTEQFYWEKAEEHAALMTSKDRESGCIDLGCGAGELLYHLSDLIKIHVGLDYSNSMLEAARRRLVGKEILLLNRDIFDYLKRVDKKVWMTCAGTNQYEEAPFQKKLLDAFVNDQTATSFYLFDCVDPIRYSILNLGISYRPRLPISKTKAMARTCYHILRSFYMLINWALKYNVESYYLGSPSMGWGYLPGFWLKEGAIRNIEVSIVSSRVYEYRYHVLMQKKMGNWKPKTMVSKV